MSTKTSSKAVCGDSVSFNRSRRRNAMLGGLTSSVCLQKCAIIIISLLELRQAARNYYLPHLQLLLIWK